MVPSLGGLLVVLAGCGTASSPAASPDVTPPAPSAVPAMTTSPPPFACAEAVRRPGTVPNARIIGLDVANEGGVGRITFTFEPEGNVAGVPEIEVRPADPPFVQDPSGQPIEVPGAGHVVVTLFGGTALDEAYNPTFDGPLDVDPAGEPIVAVRHAGDFEAVSTFVVGLAGTPCVRVLSPDGTGRLVIEIVRE